MHCMSAPDHAWLHTDSRYVTACENAARHKPLEVSAERETHAQFAAKRWSDRGAGAVDALFGHRGRHLAG